MVECNFRVEVHGNYTRCRLMDDYVCDEEDCILQKIWSEGDGNYKYRIRKLKHKITKQRIIISHQGREIKRLRKDIKEKNAVLMDIVHDQPVVPPVDKPKGDD